MFEDVIARHLVSYVQPDVIQCGGITELKKIAAMAEAQFIEVAPHCPGSLSTGLGLASLHVDASTSNCVIQESRPTPTGQRLELFNGRAITVKGGYAELPPWPGLGLHLNEEVAKKYPPSKRIPRCTSRTAPWRIIDRGTRLLARQHGRYVGQDSWRASFWRL